MVLRFVILLISNVLISLAVVGQAVNEPALFSKTDTAAGLNACILTNSRNVYQNQGKWGIGLKTGLRKISDRNLADMPDTVTFADFNSRHFTIGLDGRYYLLKMLTVGVRTDFMFLRKSENINSIVIDENGLQVEGSGHGGLMMSNGLYAQYLMPLGKRTCWLTSLGGGLITAVAEGGTGGFNFDQGQYQNTTRLKRNYPFAKIALGMSQQFSREFLIEINSGYVMAPKSDNLGGIYSPGGLVLDLIFTALIISKNK